MPSAPAGSVRSPLTSPSGSRPFGAGPDDEIVAARAELWQRYRIAAEHGAATAYAAIHAERIADLSGRKTAVIVCGANTDPRTLEIE